MSNALAGKAGPVNPIHGNKLKTLGRWSIRLLLAAVLIVALLISLFLVINWKDETLSEQAQAMSQERPMQVADAQNGFIS